jgi:baculoviral IAP repeat-containing protein 6
MTLTDGNIFTWNIILPKFNNPKLNFNSEDLLKYNIKGIEIELSFHGEFYPNYPPLIKIINPKLKNSLNYRISNSKMVQLDYWTPARSIQYIIERISEILEKFGEIDIISLENEKNINKTIIELENLLIKFASFSDSVFENDEIDKDEIFIKFKDFNQNQNLSNQNLSNQNSSNKTYWKKGTGYGHNGSNDWNVEEYVISQKDKDDKLENIFRNIISILNMKHKESDFKQIITMLDKSLIIPYLKQHFKSSSILEIHKKENLFNLYILLLEGISTEESIYLFDNELNDKNNFYKIIEEKKIEFEKSLKFDKDNELASKFVNIFNNKISPIFNQYIKNKNQSQENSTINNINKCIVDEEKNTDEQKIRCQYKSILSELRFDTTSILNTNYRQDYKDLFKSEKNSSWKICQKRLASELTSFMQINQLPIDYESSIFVRADEDNPMIIRALITGPVDTPYDSGCFIFDIYTPADYPNKAPSFWFMNHGGKRFNPNLYDSGKVCLSILGTYIGPKPTQSEKWNPDISTLLQVLISIQAQILIDQPYFNEPGFESEINTDSGKKKSNEYNYDIRLYTMKSTVKDLLSNTKTYPQFEEIIKEHFKLKKDHVLKTYEKWVSESPAKLKSEYEKVFEEIRSLLSVID